MKHNVSWENLINTLKTGRKGAPRFEEPQGWQEQLMLRVSELQTDGSASPQEGETEAFVWKICGASLALSLVFQLYLNFSFYMNEYQILNALNPDPLNSLIF